MNNQIIKLEYDKEVDAAYLNLTQTIQPGEVEDTIILGQRDERIDGMINVDFDKDGRLLGIEVLDASLKLRSDLLEMSGRQGFNAEMVKDISFLMYNETYMIGRSDATEYARRLIHAEQIILGIEGFHYDGENLTPDMGCIVDFTDTPDEKTVNEALSAILSTKINFVEFTLK